MTGAVHHLCQKTNLAQTGISGKTSANADTVMGRRRAGSARARPSKGRMGRNRAMRPWMLSEQEAEVVAGGGEDGVDGVAARVGAVRRGGGSTFTSTSL